MSDLLVDTQTLRRCGSSLRRVHAELEGATRTARPDRDVIAHPRLRGRLEEFADGWDDRRTEIVTAIEGLSDAAEGCADAYENVESELVQALQGKK